MAAIARPIAATRRRSLRDWLDHEQVLGWLLVAPVVILLLGGNDFLRQVPPDTTFANLATMIERLQADGAAVLLAGVRGGLLRDNFAARYEALAGRYRTAYVHDVLDDTLGVPGYMADQVHPNDAGYAVIADRVFPVLSRMLE